MEDDDDVFEELHGLNQVQTNANVSSQSRADIAVAEPNQDIKPLLELSSDVITKNVDNDSKLILPHYIKVECALETSPGQEYHNLYVNDVDSNSNQENKSGIVPKQKLLDDTGKDLDLVVVAAKSSECDEKLHEMLLSTRENLLVSLQQDDLQMLQEKYNKQACVNGKMVSSKPPWHRGKSNQTKPFGCRSCKFLGIRKFDLIVHILENHKEVAVEKNIPPEECLVAGNDPRSVSFRCVQCTFVTKFKSSFFNHLITHKSLDEVQTFSCSHCSFITKSKNGLIRHLQCHQVVESEELYKCPHCTFRTVHKKYIDTHIRMIHEAFKVKQFNCARCSFQTKYQTSYQNHLLLHKTHRKMYKCELCPFQTPHLAVLRKSHQLTHVHDESAKIFMCAECPFKTKRKDDLARHVTMHRNPDEIEMWKCGICPYKTRHKYILKAHRMTHEAPDKDNMLPCSLCPYQARSERHMRQHMTRKHVPLEQCKFYKCDECSYRSKVSTNVTRHSLTHRSPEELTYLKCHLCEYQGITRARIALHYKNIHMNPKDVKWHQCKLCDYKSRQRGNLSRHMLSHQHPERDLVVAASRKCKDCGFVAKTKSELLDHALKHDHMYIKCDQCKYKTQYKGNLIKHKRKQHSCEMGDDD